MFSTYSFEERSAVFEFLLESDAFPLGDWKLTTGVVQLTLGFFKGGFKVL